MILGIIISSLGLSVPGWAVLLLLIILVISNRYMNRLDSRHQILWSQGMYVLFILIGSAVATAASTRQMAELTGIIYEENLICDAVIQDAQRRGRWIRAQSRVRHPEDPARSFTALVYLQPPEDGSVPKPGDLIRAEIRFSPLESGRYLRTFDLASYWKHKGIRVQGWSRSPFYILDRPESRGPIYHMIRQAQRILTEAPLSEDHRALIYALLVGDKSLLSQDTRDLYARAGVAHILAVSGLHVGILSALMLLALWPIRRIHRSYNIAGHLLVVLLLFLYAAICQWSPSVSRSTLMFSFLIIGRLWPEDYIPMNILGVVAMILLLVQPALIYDLGFQMSFLAVSGILIFYKPIYDLWNPRYKIIKYIWAMAAISIAAQLAVLPLQLYHFHRFPLAFIPNSIYSIGLLHFVLAIGLLLVVGGSLVAGLINPLGQVLNGLLYALSYPVQLQYDQSYLAIEDLWIAPGLLLLLIATIACLAVAMHSDTRRWRPWTAGLLSLCLLVSVGVHQYTKSHDILIYYPHYGDTQSIEIIHRGQSIILGKSLRPGPFTSDPTHSYYGVRKSRQVDWDDSYADEYFYYTSGWLRCGDRTYRFARPGTVLGEYRDADVKYIYLMDKVEKQLELKI